MNIKGNNLSIYDVYKIAVDKEPVELDIGQMDMVQSSYERIQQWGQEKHPIYGVNTGFGELIPVIIPPQYKQDLQVNLIRSHAAGIGLPFPDEVVRAIMVCRLNCLMKGYSGADPNALKLLKEFLNRGIHPIIPRQGSLGASGDLVPLAHMTLPIIGEGYVRKDGETRKSLEVLKEEGLEPVELSFKGGLTLINGTSAMTGAACVALVKAYQLFKWGVIASADFIQTLRGSTAPFEERGHALKNHSGQIIIARELYNLLQGNSLTKEHAELMDAISEKISNTDELIDTGIYLQSAYTLRSVPQVLGPVLETFNFCRRLIEEEINSSNDNPLIFDVPEKTFHGANFHGQYVAMACDYMNIAITEIGVLAERQLNRLVDPHLNGDLRPFLAHDRTGLFCGFEGGQYLATSIASENLDLAAPSSVKSLPSNGSNQDIVSMGVTSARKSLRLCKNVSTILSSLVTACNQASFHIGNEKYSPPLQKLHEQLYQRVSEYKDEKPLFEIFASIQEFMNSKEGWAYVDENIKITEAA